MAASIALTKISLTKSALFGENLVMGSAQIVNLAKIRALSTRSELKTTEKQFNNVLYSTPLKKTLVDHHMAHTQQGELQHAVEKIREIMASKLSLGSQVEELVLVDTIQRLGIEHYFHEEIRAILERDYVKYCALEEGDLHEVALRFRLMRQAGFHVTTDTFTKFKNKDGSFKQELSLDPKGLMSLFEASHLGIQGDDILDEAGEFSRQLLKLSLETAGQREATIVRTTLGNPFLRSSPRLMANNFLNSLEPSLKFRHNLHCMPAWTTEVQYLARIDLNIAQITHQSEITQIHRWWKELNLTKELKLARDQPVKWHIWSLAALPNPAMKHERMELTKPISFIYLMDDIFDIYGTLEELTLFTEAVNRWDYTNIEGLPNYMKMCLKALQDTTREMCHKIYIKHGWDPQTCFKNAWADLCNAFLVEARWFASGHLPSTEEYLKNGLRSSGMPLVAMHIFYLLGQGINTESIQHLNNFPELVSSMASVLRLSDDLGSCKDENQDGYDGSYIECYRNEHKGNSAESAEDSLRKLISEAWKCLNKTCLSPSPFSAEFVSASVNLTRLVPMMYSYDHNRRLPSLEKHMKSLLYDSVN